MWLYFLANIWILIAHLVAGLLGHICSKDVLDARQYGIAMLYVCYDFPYNQIID